MFKKILYIHMIMALSFSGLMAIDGKHAASRNPYRTPTIVKPDGGKIKWEQEWNVDQKLSDLRGKLEGAGIMEEKDLFNGVPKTEETRYTAGMIMIDSAIYLKPLVAPSHKAIFRRYGIIKRDKRYFVGLNDQTAKELALCIKSINGIQDKIGEQRKAGENGLEYDQKMRELIDGRTRFCVQFRKISGAAYNCNY